MINEGLGIAHDRRPACDGACLVLQPVHVPVAVDGDDLGDVDGIMLECDARYACEFSLQCPAHLQGIDGHQDIAA